MKPSHIPGLERAFGILLAAGIWAAASGADAAYVIATIQGQRVDGTDIRAKSDGEIILTTPQGTRSFFKGQYLKAVADKPPEMDRAAQMIEGKQFDEAAKMLEDVILRYRFLDWDNRPAMLPKIYAKKGGFSRRGRRVREALHHVAQEQGGRGAAVGVPAGPARREAVRQAGGQLTQVAAGGARADAARAQIMRGDVKAAQGQVEAAALDYLRTVVLFASEKTSQPEALLKAGDALEKLRDARAKEMYRMLVSEYPASPQAAVAKGKL